MRTARTIPAVAATVAGTVAAVTAIGTFAVTSTIDTPAPTRTVGEVRGVVYDNSAMNGHAEPNDEVTTATVTRMINGRRVTMTRISIAVKAYSTTGVTFNAPERVDTNSKATFSGKVPVKAGSTSRRPVEIQQLINGTWRGIAPVKAQTTGAYKITLTTPPKPMVAKFRASVAKFEGKPAAVSAARTVGIGTEEEVAALKRQNTAQDWTWLFEDQAVWQSCEVTWAYKPAGGYSGALNHVRTAFDRVEAVSNLTFVEVPTADDDTDITVEWATPTQEPALKGSTVGVARVHVADDSSIYDVAVVLDRTETKMKRGFDGSNGNTWGAVMMHEITHGLGLNHADGNKQIMYPASTTGVWGKGDKAGHIAASQHC